MKTKTLIGLIVLIFVAVFLGHLIRARLAQEIGVIGSWDTTSFEDGEFSFPRKLESNFIYTADWPPRVLVSDAPYLCTTIGSETRSPETTQERLINKDTYCVTEISVETGESNYTHYVYLFVKDGKTVAMAFSLRLARCSNYGGDKKTSCIHEQETFSIDTLIDNIVHTIKFK